MKPELLQQVVNEGGISGQHTFRLSRFARQWRRGAPVPEFVREAMTTDDFGYMSDLIDRGVMTGYMDEVVPTTYMKIAFRRDSTTFENAKDYRLNAAKLIPRVMEKGEYTPIQPIDENYEFTMYKYGCQFDLSWEAWLRDQRDLSLLGDYPPSWGLSARHTQEYLATSAYAANATFFSAANGNVGTGVLNEANLDIGITDLRTGRTDPSGNVAVYAGPIYLVVPPALKSTANRIVLSTQIVVAGATDINLGNINVMDGAAEVVENVFLPVIDTTNGDTSWYLFAEPRIRPAMRYGFLKGYETPEIFVKDSDARALAGGGEDPFGGSFLNDDIEFKLRFTFGVDMVDPNGAYRSTGTV